MTKNKQGTFGCLRLKSLEGHFDGKRTKIRAIHTTMAKWENKKGGKSEREMSMNEGGGSL